MLPFNHWQLHCAKMKESRNISYKALPISWKTYINRSSFLDPKKKKKKKKVWKSKRETLINCNHSIVLLTSYHIPFITNLYDIWPLILTFANSGKGKSEAKIGIMAHHWYVSTSIYVIDTRWTNCIGGNSTVCRKSPSKNCEKHQHVYLCHGCGQYHSRREKSCPYCRGRLRMEKHKTNKQAQKTAKCEAKKAQKDACKVYAKGEAKVKHEENKKVRKAKLCC